MIVPTSSPASARVSMPRWVPSMICSSRQKRARVRYSMTTRSTTRSGRSRARIFLRVLGVEAILVFHEDRARRSEDLRGEEDAGVRAVRRDGAAVVRLLPVTEGRHARHDRDAAHLEVERQLLEVVVEHEDAA